VQIIAPGFINTDVSTKLLTEDGSTWGVKSKAQEKGMKPEACAASIVKALKTDKVHVGIGGYEMYSVPVKKHFPKMFYWLMRRMQPE
jgi:short-subunit dehydrogenase